MKKGGIFNEKNFKKLILLLLAVSVVCIIPHTNASAASSCCDHMMMSSYNDSDYADETPCSQHQGCTKVVVKVYKVRYCKNCGAEHSRTLLRTQVKHTSTDEF